MLQGPEIQHNTASLHICEEEHKIGKKYYDKRLSVAHRRLRALSLQCSKQGFDLSTSYLITTTSPSQFLHPIISKHIPIPLPHPTNNPSPNLLVAHRKITARSSINKTGVEVGKRSEHLPENSIRWYDSVTEVCARNADGRMWNLWDWEGGAPGETKHLSEGADGAVKGKWGALFEGDAVFCGDSERGWLMIWFWVQCFGYQSWFSTLLWMVCKVNSRRQISGPLQHSVDQLTWVDKRYISHNFP